MAADIPPGERLITIEDSLELGLERFPDLHPNVVAMEERLPNSEGQGAISERHLTDLAAHFGFRIAQPAQFVEACLPADEEPAPA